MPRPPPPAVGLPAWWLGSVAAHLLIAALLIFWPDPRPHPSEALPPPSFDIVFEGGAPEQPAEEPPPGLEMPPTPPNLAEAPPPPQAPPVPSQPSLPPMPAEAAPPPMPPSPPAPPVQQALPLPPPVERPPQIAEPLPPLPGAVELFTPPTELRLPDRLADALPPPPPPTPQPPPAPRAQQPAPRPQQAQPNLPGIWAPGGVQLGRPATPPAGRRQGRGVDLSVDPRMLEGRPRADPSVRVTGAQVGADWRAAFRRWLDQNISYPQRAIALGEDGTVRVRVTVAPDGTVRDVRLIGPSTSPSLNFGTSYPFNGARLPAFPPGADPNGVTIDLTVNYVLIRR